MSDAIEVAAAFWGALLITYAAIFVVGGISRGAAFAARSGSRLLRAYLKRA